jgi:hypothetical protein
MSKKITLMFVLMAYIAFCFQLKYIHAENSHCAVDLIIGLDGGNEVNMWAVDVLTGLPLADGQVQTTVLQGGQPLPLITASTDINAVTEALNEANQAGEINLYDLLKLSETAPQRVDVPRVLLLVTDGYIAGIDAQTLAQTIRGEAVILIVAIGEMKVNELVSIAGQDYNVLQVENATALTTITTLLQNAVCSGGKIFLCSVHSILTDQRVNMRVAPGLNQVWVDFMPLGAEMNVIGQAKDWEDVTWWQLENGYWVRHDIVGETGDCDLVPVVNP